MTAVVRGDALHLPLADESVDLIVTSPPYFALRSYRDACQACHGTGDARWDDAFDAIKMAWIERTNRLEDDEPWPPAPTLDPDGYIECPVCRGTTQGHYDGQIGSEPTPQQFLEALWAVTKECWRVLKPSGSMFVNLGDKRSGSGGHNNSNLAGPSNKSTLTGSRANRTGTNGVATRRNAPDRYNQTAFGRPKSKMLLPHRYAIGCEEGLADPDGVGWIVRQDMVWNKPNGLPESVTDRVRDSHEYWFHQVKSERYFSAIDEIRETSAPPSSTALNGPTSGFKSNTDRGDLGMGNFMPNSLGKLPGSVWTVPSEPLSIPEWLGVDHFAAFPQEWPRRLILGWTPSGICTVCGEGRRPVVAKEHDPEGRTTNGPQSVAQRHESPGREVRKVEHATITGYACACTPWRDHPCTGETSGPSYAAGVANSDYVSNLANGPKVGPWREYLTDGWTPPPTRPAVVLDPFGGTGTVAMVARALGRTGISLDLSADYTRLAKWRIFQSGHAAKTRARTNRDRQGTML